MKTPSMIAALMIGLAAGLAAHPAVAADSLSLDDTFRVSLARAESVALQDENIKQAETVYDQAKASMQPNINGLASYTVQQPSKSTTSNTFAPDNEPLAKVTATQPLFRGLRDFAALRENTALINASKLDRDAAVVQLYKDVAQAFYAVTASDRDLTNIRTELEFYEKRIKELKKFNSIGRSQLSDVLTAQSAALTLRAQEKLVKGQLRTNREILAVLTGLDPDVPLRYNTGLPTEPGDLGVGLKQIGGRPEVVAADERVLSADEAVSIARGARMPSIDLNGDYYLVRTGVSKDVKWDVALALSVPIYDGGIITSQVESAVSRKRAGLDTKEQAKRAAVQEIRTLYAAILSDHEQIDDLEKATDLAKRTYEAESKDYRLGLVTNLDVLQSLTSFQEDQRALDKAKFQLLADYEHFEASIGQRPKGFALSVPPPAATPDSETQTSPQAPVTAPNASEAKGPTQSEY